MGRPRTPLADRFWSRVRIGEEHECWPWLGHKDSDGYGQISLGGKLGRIVRIGAAAWLLKHGELPTLQVLHRCDNPECVNPSHLFLGTQADNMRDMVAKGRKAVRRGEANRCSKLTASDVLAIRAAAGKKPQAEIARRFGVSASVISEVIQRKAWTHVA